MSALYVTHGMRRAKINFTMFLTFFEYVEFNATIYAKVRILQFKISLENHSTRTLTRVPTRSLIQYTAHIYIYACFIYLKLISSMLNIMPSDANFNYSCKSSNFAILGHV